MKKYTVWAIEGSKTTMYCYSLTSNEEFKKFKKVAEVRTAAEAKKMINDLGWIVANN